MKKVIIKIKRELKSFWKNYPLQSFLATAVIFAAIMYLNIMENPVIIASLGATTFIVFAMPNNITAKPKCIIGGHLVGLACGFLCASIPPLAFANSIIVQSLVTALAVGLSIFVMVIIDTEHPPASRTALGIAIKSFSWNVTITMIVFAVLLVLIQHYFKKHLKDLT